MTEISPIIPSGVSEDFSKFSFFLYDEAGNIGAVGIFRDPRINKARYTRGAVTL
jgi:hypothetical protein